jgi:hypothetical protein
MRNIIYSLLQNHSLVLAEIIEEKWSTPVNFKDRFVVPNTISYAIQNLTYLEVMLNFVVDINLAANKHHGNKIIVGNVVSFEFKKVQDSSNFVAAINQQINKDRDRSLFIQIAMIIVVVLCLVPVWLFLRTRLPLHEKIFDLMVSIDIDMVMK